MLKGSLESRPAPLAAGDALGALKRPALRDDWFCRTGNATGLVRAVSVVESNVGITLLADMPGVFKDRLTVKGRR